MRPVPLRILAARAFREIERCGSIFDLPSRNFAVPDGRNAVSIHGRRAAAPLGPSAGPHTQLAQNIVLCWLGGARVMELKTVQVLDALTIPRPCIDARTVGYNVEWSQELRIEESLDEYVKASMLIDLLAAHFAVARDTVFDVSVGYDLAGIRNENVVAFLRGMIDARDRVDALRGDLDAAFVTNIAGSVTLSTFHGCPPHEIESIAEFLMTELALDVSIKLNPTLLGRHDVVGILHDRLGYRDVVVPASAFDDDPTFEQSLDIAGRLRRRAQQLGRGFGIKLTNTLVVENRSEFLPRSERLAYLSGAPLHVLAMHLVQRFRRAMPELPISFSAGIDRFNYPDAVALGLAPVTVCTDLLKQGGYGRLHGYAAELADRMPLAPLSIDDYVAKIDADSRYGAERVERRAPRRPAGSSGSSAEEPRNRGTQELPGLSMFDCAMCDLCIEVCPNDALFRIDSLEHHAKRHQIVCFADVCNDCGNCETFCPDAGAPHRRKPRVDAEGSVVPEDVAAYVSAAVFDTARVNYVNAPFVMVSEGDPASARGMTRRVACHPDHDDNLSEER